uniref:Uncharacterized protein n=1 Tax=Cucumis sativus TaxID=3659 RepID=A0A0A0LC31_CUCSA
MVPTPFLCRRRLFAVTQRYLRLVNCLISLGSSLSAEQDARIKVCKFFSLKIEFGSRLIFLFPCKSRYLSCTRFSTALGIPCRFALPKCNSLKYLNLSMHAFARNALGGTLSLIVKAIDWVFVTSNTCFCVSRRASFSIRGCNLNQ